MRIRALATLLALTAPLRALEPLAIQDNSFLIEEAYNQDPGVVQYIFNFVHESEDSVLTFTNELPLHGLRHQISYSLSMARLDGAGGITDSAISYRYQLAGDANARLAISPRFSLLVPTGDAGEGRGTGDWGYELGLPVSVAHTDRVVSHWNAGLSATHWFRGAPAFFLGGSVIGAVREKVHLMLEARWEYEQEETNYVVSPGVRWGWDLENGFQIVPGIAIPITDDNTSVFVYFSVER